MFRSSIPTAAKFCSWSCLHFLSICNQTSQERPQNDRYIRPFTISTAANVKVPTNSRLYQDQNLSHTAKGHNKVTKEHVSLAKLPSFMESNYDSEMLQRSSGDPVNSQTTKIIQNLYVTSLGGLKSKQLLNYKVNLLLNATIDLPNVDVPNAETIRVPISEKEPDTFTIYINDVADKIHENYLKNGQTVIYCLDGNRNSMALSLGYLLKYTDLQLSEALTHLQYSRKGFEMMKGNLGPFKKPVELFAKKVKKNEGLGSNDRSVSNEERSNSKQKSTSNSKKSSK